MNDMAPNFRDGKCCATCSHYKIDYDGDGTCTKFTITDPARQRDKNHARWFNVCDDWDHGEPTED